MALSMSICACNEKLMSTCMLCSAPYEPPNSRGPGAKTYDIHLYALSAPPVITSLASSVDRETLLTALKDKILATAVLHVVHISGGRAAPADAGR